jgi:hypothetical protein
MIANLIAFIATVVTFAVMWVATAGQIRVWPLLSAAAVYFRLANILARCVSFAPPGKKAVSNFVGSGVVNAVAGGVVTIACFVLADFGLGINVIVSALCAGCAGVAVFLTGRLVGLHLRRDVEADELLGSNSSAGEIVEFLARRRPGNPMAAASSVALLLAVAIPVFSLIFIHNPRGNFGDVVVGGMLIAVVGGGIVAASQFAALWTFLDRRKKQVIGRFRNSADPKCRQAIEEYDRWLADERAKTVFCLCPQCRQRLTPPEDLTGLTHLLCRGCGHRLEIDAASAQVSAAISTNAFDARSLSNFPILLSDGRVVLCAGQETRVFDLRDVENISLGFNVNLLGNSYLVSFTHGKHRVELAEAKGLFRKALLRAYSALHPYSGEPACWFCARGPGESRLAISLPIHRVVSRSVTEKSHAWQVGMQFEKRTVYVPRCVGCAKAHRHAESFIWRSILSGAAALLGACLLFFLFAAYVDRNSKEPALPAWVHWRFTPTLALLTSGVLIPAGIWGMVRTKSAEKRFYRERRIRPAVDLDLFPPYRAAWEQGFRQGEKPTGREVYYGQHEEG